MTPAGLKTEAQKAMMADSDAESDAWGFDLAEDRKEDLDKEIEANKKAIAPGWEKEEWTAPPEADASGSEDEKNKAPVDWKDMFKKDEEAVEEIPDEDGEYPDKDPEDEWTLWVPHSHESMMATTLVQKIRVRGNKADQQGGSFPSPEVGQVLKSFVTQQKAQQRTLLAALLWIEANVNEIQEVPPDLNDAIKDLFKNELATLKRVVERVPDTVLLTKAASKIPERLTRKKALEVQVILAEALHKKLSETKEVGELEELNELVEDVLGHVPKSVRILALVHAYEYAMLKGGSAYRDLDELAVAFAKQQSPDRAFEMVCRLNLGQSLKLAEAMVTAEVDLRRANKISSLNRLYAEWTLNPSEEELSQLHLLSMVRQCQVLLNIERDIELVWYHTMGKFRSEEERNNAMRKYLVFTSLIKPYLRDEKAKGEKKVLLEDEAGIPFSSDDMGLIRKAIATVFHKLKERYGWTPDIHTRRACSKINWVARLSSLLILAGKPQCLHADEELRRLLQRENHVKLGQEVLSRFKQWDTLESGEGVVLRAPVKLDEEDAEEKRKLYREYRPDLGKLATAEGYMPMTPAVGMGMAGMTPGGYGGSMTPAYMMGAPGTPSQTLARRRAAGTPAGPPPATPFGGPPMSPGPLQGGTPHGTPATPFGAPPASPRPGGRPPGTPAGPPPATPAGFRASYPGTPSGPPPATPFNPRAYPGTPAGPPPPTFGSPPERPPTFGVISPPETGALGRRHGPGTPEGPGTPGAGPGTPGTPFGAGLVTPATPAGPPPATPAGFRPAPFTPAQQHAPFTPAGPVPLTPGARPGSWGGLARAPQNTQSRIPSTPMEAHLAHGQAPPAGGISRIPTTPRGAAPRPAMPGTTGTSLASASFVPMTPRGAGGGGAVPMTPRGATPMTPAGAGMTPSGAAPATPRGAFLPAGSARGGFVVPQTPMGLVAPATPTAALRRP